VVAFRSVGIAERSKVVTWSDPRASAAAGARLSGLEYFAAMAAGEIPLPPISALMGIEPIEFSEGRAVFAATPGEEHFNPIGMVHGGLALTLLDSVMGCAVHTTLPAGTGYTSLEVKVNFVRAVPSDGGRVIGEGSVVHRGGRTATAEGRVRREHDGALLAHGTTTCLVLRP
jgi:uncharacterized protein (TIGR00369 family)